MILPFVAAILLKVLFKPVGEGISITGAYVYFTIPMPLMDLPISESQVNSVAVVLSLLGLCLYLTRGLKVKPDSKRQIAAEYIVEKTNNLILDNMGPRFMAFAPFVAGIMGISAFSSLSSLLGLFPPTSDMNIVAGWAILVFILITHYKLKGGVGPYVKGFFEPVPIFAPFNIIGEFATPVSMSFRHYGNVLSGVVIATLVGSALGNLTNMLLGWLPGFLGEIPFLQVGIPAILSMYFDIFSGVMQAFIFAMLTMLYIATGFPEEEYERRKAKRNAKKALPTA
ncbi:MAG: F0F1 ATP synthase subunit A [Clostridia bacterium]|nr:F0F1 ATP synthase subunit A [Clostridia bacterium]